MKDDRRYDGDERKFNGQRGLIEDPRRRTITHDKMRGRIPDGREKAMLPNRFIGPDIPRFASDVKWMKAIEMGGEQIGG